MKKNLLLLLGAAVMFFSCQNESTEAEEQAQTRTEAEIAAEEEILSSEIEIAGIDEGDDAIQMNAESEILAQRETKNQGLTFSTASKSTSAECEADIEGFAASLPETVSVFTKLPECIEGGGSFAALDIDDGYLAGLDIPAWCADLEGQLTGGTFSYDVYSSYEDVSGLEQSPGVPLFENPNDFDRINWLLNQNIIGTESKSEEGGIYTFGHLQWAIWEIIEGTGNNCTDDCDFLSCDPIDQWDNDKDNNERLGLELVAAAEASGEGFVPQCGQKIAVILASTTSQSLIITKEVPEKEKECDDCEGDVDKLTMEFDWHYAKRVRIYQKYENTCWGKKVFDKVLQPGEEFTIEGVNHDGSFGKYIYIYIGDCYYTKIKTNCYLNIGPGYEKGVFNVISGTSTHGGELCEYVKPEPTKCYRHWTCYYYYKYCIYGY
ncbi:hypothetical protein EYD45_00925 [Hyunsoonleella flava]|uniref:Uncharacterized protein n=1 Tax=Hyunsoonleella flava TaxID=2527939 RepID=A0A4V2JAF6_9FLAO|nr:hypothetical protein [Hyunsoonleella flava]TBN06476.1 hypothetical protein EYD45_00925 [Hyunsoonleella flava]